MARAQLRHHFRSPPGWLWTPRGSGLYRNFRRGVPVENRSLYRITPKGQIFKIPAGSSGNIAVDFDGNCYSGTSSISILTPAGNVELFAGGATAIVPDGVRAWGAAVHPAAFALDGSGRIVYAESGTCLLRRVGAGGFLETIGGNGSCGSDASPGKSLAISLFAIRSLAVAPDGSIYMARADGAAAHLTSGGEIEVLTSKPLGGRKFPAALAVDSKGKLFESAGGGVFHLRLTARRPRSMSWQPRSC